MHTVGKTACFVQSGVGRQARSVQKRLERTRTERDNGERSNKLGLEAA